MTRSAALLALLPLLALDACRSSPSSSSVDSGDARACALADRVLEAMGGRKAWEETRYVSWNFMGKRRHLWDKHTGDLRIDHGDRVSLVNLGEHTGRVFENGVEITDSEAKSVALDQAFAAFINDSYWMFMPYKLRDPGVHLAYLGERRTTAGNEAEGLELTFEHVGRTPENRYEVLVGKTSGLVEQWDFFPTRTDAEPKLSTPWSGWKRFGRILLCTEHGDGNDWRIAVHEVVPKSAFTDPGPVRMP